ncbi:MAG: hypothetical protein AB8G95_08425 [Anaerolineae bacterium]
MGGFPTWTLIGMGVSAGLAVLLTALAYLAQSPNLLVRFRMAGSRLSQSGRRLTGLGLAATLVAGGFFMAGVPLGSLEPTADASTEVAELQSDGSADSDSGVDPAALAASSESGDNGQPTAENGAFGSEPPASADSATGEESEGDSGSGDASDNTSGAFSQPAQVTPDSDSGSSEAASASAATTAEPTNTVAPSATPAPTQTPTSTSTPLPTSTPTATPTNTPTPTMTPTAISDDTITVDFDGDITWVYRVPGNQRLELVDNGEQLLLESGRAMVVGITWQEVRLLDGRPGWIQLNFLDLGDSQE